MTQIDLPTPNSPQTVADIVKTKFGTWTKDEWGPFYEKYHDFHRNPELSGEEPETFDAVKSAIHGFKLTSDKLTIYKDIGKTVDKQGLGPVGRSLVAVLWPNWFWFGAVQNEYYPSRDSIVTACYAMYLEFKLLTHY